MPKSMAAATPSPAALPRRLAGSTVSCLRYCLERSRDSVISSGISWTLGIRTPFSPVRADDARRRSPPPRFGAPVRAVPSSFRSPTAPVARGGKWAARWPPDRKRAWDRHAAPTQLKRVDRSPPRQPPSAGHPAPARRGAARGRHPRGLRHCGCFDQAIPVNRAGSGAVSPPTTSMSSRSSGAALRATIRARTPIRAQLASAARTRHRTRRRPTEGGERSRHGPVAEPLAGQQDTTTTEEHVGGASDEDHGSRPAGGWTSGRSDAMG